MKVLPHGAGQSGRWDGFAESPLGELHTAQKLQSSRVTCLHGNSPAKGHLPLLYVFPMFQPSTQWHGKW